MATGSSGIGRLRTWLYVPGHRGTLLEGADGRGADAIIADLEDAVPLDAREVARGLVTTWLAGSVRGSPWVRVGEATLAVDVGAVVGPGLAGIVLARAQLDLLDVLEGSLAAAEEARGLSCGTIPVVALLETAVGILDARAVARHPRVVLLAIGEADLAAELRLVPSPDDRELLALRSQVVLASAAAGLPAPMGPVCTEFRDHDVLADTTRAVVAQGFGALAAIHPAQVGVLARALRPDAPEVAHAEGVLAALDAAGGAAAVGPDGRMVDEAVARRAREVLDRAR